MNRALLCLISAALLAQPVLAEGPAADGKAAFTRLKTLVGDWEGPGPVAGGPRARVEYRLTSNGTALAERLFPGTPHEMMTVYYMDGNDLVLTHYCVGNQPHMKLVSGGAQGELKFDFASGSNLDVKKDSHMHAATFKSLDGDRYEAEWTSMADGKLAGSHSFAMTRVGK
jgi:hypothetical protein